MSVFAWNFFGEPELFAFFWEQSALENYRVPWHDGNLLGQFFLPMCVVIWGLCGILLERQYEPRVIGERPGFCSCPGDHGVNTEEVSALCS